MKQLEMSKSGVLEMQQEEMRETDGGFLPAVWGLMIAIDLGLMAVYATYDAAGKLDHSGSQPKPHGAHR